MTLYFMDFNNYYNRKVIKLDTVNDYYNTYNATIKEGINFNPNDHVNTQLTVNWDYDWLPNYALVVDPDTNDFTRWFIIDAVRIRGKQYQMQFRRDVVADHLDDVLDADTFIEKAILQPDDPLIYNSENMTVNQIKTDEWILQDSSKCAWVVGYYGDDFTIEQDVVMKGEYQEETSFDYSIPISFNQWINQMNTAVMGTRYTIISSLQDKYAGKGSPETVSVYTSQFDLSGYHVFNRVDATNVGTARTVITDKMKNTGWTGGTIFPSRHNTTYAVGTSASDIDALFYPNRNSIISILKNYKSFLTEEEANELILKYNNKIVKFIDSSGVATFYKLSIKTTNTSPYWINVGSSDNNSLSETLEDTCNFKKYGNNIYPALDQESYFQVGVNLSTFQITAEIQEAGTYYVDIHDGKDKLIDAPYRMFCMPYPINSNIHIINVPDYPNEGSKGDVWQTGAVSLRIASSLAKKYGGAKQIYDIQILPFCPLPLDIINTNGEIDSDKLQSSMYDIIYFKSNPKAIPTIAGYVFYSTVSSFTVDIPFKDFTLNNIKMSNETDIMRLVSPNYNGQFEFSPSKNGGISSFNVDCTYLPFQPYIHVNPKFGELYGRDFNDTRGLVCGGDFSIAQISDAWSTYQIQNKNYQNIFDREIQNMEVHQKFERRREIINSATGILQGGISGGVAGAKGGVAGAIAGAAIGTLSSAFGAGLDYQMNESLRHEALDYKNDMFGYQLGNIKALPQSLTRTTAFTYNNKYFPILEYYTCKEREKRAVANKIAYNSMTVMAIGKLRDYSGNKWEYDDITSKGYIKGSIIRMNIDGLNFNILNAISDEVYKGVYLQ